MFICFNIIITIIGIMICINQIRQIRNLENHSVLINKCINDINNNFNLISKNNKEGEKFFIELIKLIGFIGKRKIE